ncbi:HD domain-containing protein [Clostridium sp. 'White wine YQ']|uniref:HD domain-containing protein n=1 Tax=Clostridium sp. 'White wine YQ' TaxID=3027474 RepID=UPI002365EAEF|nr:HDIG domain-containing metalloprotein [Clostridium sp. 'White wine YQ']MDD7792949.1 HDIG domain-containing protein [Clostridium sp. 'White wine YQ']
MNNQEIFNEIDKHLLEDQKPSIFLKTLFNNNSLKGTVFHQIERLATIEQSPKYHPEGNVLNHVMLVVDEAANLRDRSSDKRALMWAALLHDIGKLTTTKMRNGRWTSYNHDNVGSEMVGDFIMPFNNDRQLVEKISNLVKYHMHYLYVEKNLPFANIKGLINDISIDEIALLSYADRCGRGELSEKDRINTEKAINNFKSKLNSKKEKMSLQTV